jgi:DHA1 family multidrug resistance protein-like MFS transporter
MFVAQLMTAVGFSSIGPFLPLYVKELGSSTGQSVELLVALVFSAQAFTMMLASPIWGHIADRYSRKLMVERAMFGGALMLFLMGFARTGEQLVALRAIQGLLTGTVAASYALVASDAPRGRVGYAMGMLSVGAGVGVALGPVIGGAVADTYGYAPAFFVTSALLVFAGLLVLTCVHEKPVQLGATRDSADSAMARPWDLLRKPGVATTYLLRFLTQMGEMMIVPILPLFVATILAPGGNLSTFTGTVTGASAAATIVSSTYLGRLGDRVGHRTVFAFCAMAAAALYWPISMIGGSTQLLVLYSLVGVALGGIVPSIPSLLAKHTEPGKEGTAFGLENSIRSAARFLAPLAGAWLASRFGLPKTFTGAAFVFALAAVVAVVGFSRHPRGAGKRVTAGQQLHA